MNESKKSGLELDVSIVIPVMNEKDNVKILAGEISEAMESSDFTWECLWVDDFSTDGTREELKALNASDKCHRYVFHDKNYGQSAAMSTGFKTASADVLVTLDGDGQNPPSAIPLLVKELKDKDADIVNGWREKRNDSIVRKISSRVANGFRNRLTGESVRDVGCSLRAFKKECVRDIPVFKGMHRFFPTLVKMQGYDRIFEVPVGHRSRERGKTKYGINNRLWVGIADTFAICWMRWRMVYPETSEISTGKDLKTD